MSVMLASLRAEMLKVRLAGKSVSTELLTMLRLLPACTALMPEKASTRTSNIKTRADFLIIVLPHHSTEVGIDKPVQLPVEHGLGELDGFIDAYLRAMMRK